MRKCNYCFLTLGFLLIFVSCSSQIKTVKPVIDYGALEQGNQTVALALEYYNQGGFQKSGDLFLEAADLFQKANVVAKEKKALIAAAKVQLKSNNRKEFMVTMTRFKELLGKLEMPLEDERLLINLASYMEGARANELPYPIIGKWQVIFN